MTLADDVRTARAKRKRPAVRQAVQPPAQDLAQHLVLTGVSWEFYESLLAEVGDRPLRITYLDGELEIMALLGEHESHKKHLGDLIPILTLECDIKRRSFGSTTFRREDKRGGLEPDDCYYFGKNADKTAGLSKFDARVHPAPDLAVEIEIRHRAVPRFPIYQRLGVREIWRYDGARLVVHHLKGTGYKVATRSLAFPFLPMPKFAAFVRRMKVEDENTVLREFRTWVVDLPR